jgi:hypothetical protein
MREIENEFVISKCFARAHLGVNGRGLAGGTLQLANAKFAENLFHFNIVVLLIQCPKWIDRGARSQLNLTGSTGMLFNEIGNVVNIVLPVEKKQTEIHEFENGALSIGIEI